MLNFLIQRPIAVLMTFLSLIILGIVSFYLLPISLLPEIPIPQVTVQISYPNTSARELENTVVQQVRNQLLQVNHLKDIQSRTQNDRSTIELDFNYGTNTDFAFLEVNEKIDQIMSSFPKDMLRPQVIKASAGDIPVMDISIMMKDSMPQSQMELSNFSKNIIKRRIEQLSQVALVDISGYVNPEVIIIPNEEIFNSLKLTEDDLRQVLVQNNLDLGSLLIQDGQYQYNIRFLSSLKSKKDIENIHINVGGQLFQIKNIAHVKIQAKKQRGKYLYNNHNAIVFSIRKKSDAQLFKLKEEINALLVSFKNDYPQLEFYSSNDQSEILEESVDSLKSSLLYGSLFAFLIMFLFFREWKAPLLIGIAIPVALIIAILGFYLFSISINVISLSGLILGVGLMIDNSIIVIENIRQTQKNTSLSKIDACTQGVNEVIRPLISSALTTCSVFLPLIFLSGISGALFYDQALSISISLFSSLLVAYFLLPTLLYLGKDKIITEKDKSKESLYAKTVDGIIKIKWLFLFSSLALLSSIYFIYQFMEKSSFPKITKNSINVEIDWNEAISLEENENRIIRLSNYFKPSIISSNSLIGEQQFLLQKNEQSINQCILTLNTNSTLNEFKTEIKKEIDQSFPFATYSIYESKNILDLIFSNDDAPLVVHLQSTKNNIQPSIKEAQFLFDFCKLNNIEAQGISTDKQLFIEILKEKLLLYDIPYNNVYDKLKSSFNQNNIGHLKSSNQIIPISIGLDQKSFFNKVNEAFVYNSKKDKIPLKSLIAIKENTTIKNITAGKSGESLNIELNKYSLGLEQHLKELINNNNLVALFSGQAFEDQKNIRELSIIFLVSIVLLYLILAAQFESLILPLIVILTVPFGIMGALGILYLNHQSINIISIIGIVVMSGIVVNDAILKVDMMNRLSKQMPIIKAIHEAGHRRIKPILMTSATTILALLPILFSSGLGAELQRPLAFAVIGGLIIGTLSSLYFIPILFLLLKKKV